jgi:hypothetical protein
MSSIADPLTRANLGHGSRYRYPFIRAHYGRIDLFKHTLAVLKRTVFIARESREIFVPRRG